MYYSTICNAHFLHDQPANRVLVTFIFNTNLNGKHEVFEAYQKYNLNEDEIGYHLTRLKELEFLEFDAEDNKKFKFTKRAILFKIGLIKQKESISSALDQKNLDLLYSFRNFKKVTV